MKSQTIVETYQGNQHHANPEGYSFLSQNTSILIIYVVFALGWAVNRLVTTRYKVTFRFKNKSGTKISVELTPPAKEP